MLESLLPFLPDVTMSTKPNNALSDLRGASRLTVDAIIQVTDIVESMHRTVTTLGGVFGEPDEPMQGLTGLLYQNIRSFTGLVGRGLDTALDPLVSLVGDMEASPGREAVVSALNGVVGDYLAETDNPLALPMRFRQNGEVIDPDSPAFREALEKAGGRLLLLIHGSCANDLHWRRKGHDHGAALGESAGYLPLYLRYNSGRHISENGRDLDEMLESLLTGLDQPVDLTILGHSMGGLVARSAIHYGSVNDHAWPDRLDSLVFLGTPHHGSPLERYGNWIDQLLQVSPYSAPFARLGRLRSAGITDLRHGYLLDDDWRGLDRFERSVGHHTPVPLPDSVQTYTIAATKVDDPETPPDNFLGDGLVPVDSALGRHPRKDLTLAIPDHHQRIVHDTSHLGLMSSREVYEILAQWLNTP
jgi:pimeloyl-ACP methyl ester carboxylesterase